MKTTHARARACVLGALLIMLAPAQGYAQHEHHTAVPTSAAALLGVVHCADGPPLSGAVIQLFHVSGTERHLVAGVLSDASGRFAVRSSPGTYVLQVSYLGHGTHERPIVMGVTPVNLGSVLLNPEALQLDAIAVSAERERVQLRSGATVVAARTSSAAAGGTVADLLRTLPGVELDAQGRITMRGSSSVLVLLNGRRIPLTDDALAAFLRQMPAGALERIEAGTSASAKQDADGSAGIVNLVTREDAPQATGSRHASAAIADRDYYNLAGGLSGVTGRRWSWDAAYAFSALRPLTRSRTDWQSFLDEAELTSSSQQSEAHARHRLHSLQLGGAAHFGNGSVGIRGSLSAMRGAYRNRTDFLNTSATGATDAAATASVLDHVIPTGDVALTFDLAGGGSRHARLTSEVRTNLTRQDFTGRFVDGGGAKFLETGMQARIAEYVVQNDVAFDAAVMRLELGQKSQLRTLRADYVTARHGREAEHVFDYDDVVHAGYASGHRMFGTVQLQAGARVEWDRTRVAAREAETALRLFPSLLVQWPRDERARTRYRAAYTRRIGRPDAVALNPYSMGEDDMNELVGNPELRSEITNQIEAGIEHTTPAATIQLTPFMRSTRDPIRPLKTLTESGRATTTLHNLERTRAAGADASVRTRIGSRLTTTMSATVYGMSTRGRAYRNDGVYVSGRAVIDVHVDERTTLQLYAFRRGAQPIEQGEIHAAGATELALMRIMDADGRARMTLRVSDPFRSDRVAFHIADPTFAQQSARRVSGPRVSLAFSWSAAGSPPQDAPVRREAPPQIF